MAIAQTERHPALGKPSEPEPAKGSRVFHGADGVLIHARTAGLRSARKKIVLIHGFPDFSFTWRHQLEQFKDRHDVYAVAIDLRGAGGSSAPDDPAAYHPDRLLADLIAVVDCLRSDKVRRVDSDLESELRMDSSETASGRPPAVHLVAHDFGCHLAWLAAMRHPKLFARMIVVNGAHPAHTRAITVVPRRMLRVAHVGLLQPPGLAEAVLSAETLLEVIAANCPRGSFLAADRAEYLAAFRRSRARSAMFSWYRGLAWTAMQRGDRNLAKVSIPVLTVHGEGEPFLDKGLVDAPPSWVDSRHSRTLALPGGHWLHWPQGKTPSTTATARPTFHAEMCSFLGLKA